MNLPLFKKLMRSKPEQCESEWLTFLEICDIYLKKAGLEKPIVVELGTYNNKQKPFWEQLLGMEHIGIDASRKRGMPDIYGDTHDPKILKTLKDKLADRPITILFVDACHRYKDIKQDFEMYAPLCNGIIVFHDLRLTKGDVGQFWDEMQERAFKGKEEYKKFLFISIYKYRKSRVQMGIGMAIRQ